MGSSVKTIVRLMNLTLSGHLPPGSEICDIGATQLFGDSSGEGAKSFLAFYAERTPKATPPNKVPPEKLAAIANNGFLGDLLLLAGFRYTALDIFHGTNTILFDLNVHAPGPKLAGRFDLVMNFGTTEHVFNQLRAFQTIHDLTKVGGVIYHDLPMAGYVNHAFFRYDPLFFSTVLPANHYELLLQEISMGVVRDVPQDLADAGYKAENYFDAGIEVVIRRTSADPFRIPMEATTALSIDPEFARVIADEYVLMPEGTSVSYGAGIDRQSDTKPVDVHKAEIEKASGRELLQQLMTRMRGRLVGEPR